MSQPTLTLRELSRRQLAARGSESTAYVRSVLVAGEPAFAVYCADGRRLAILLDRTHAFDLLRQHGLEPAAVH